MVSQEKEKKNIILRPVELKDAAIISEWYNEKENVKYMSTLVRCQHHSKESVEKEIQEIDPDYERLFMVMEEGNPNPIGHAGIDDIDFHDKRAEIFFIIGEKGAKGKGYGKLIGKQLLDHAFKVLGLNSLFATVAVANIPSMALIERIGFKKMGVRREYNLIDGQFMDEVFFDMTRKDYDLLYGK